MVLTTIMQENKPQDSVLDSRGSLIVCNALVAYNHSGGISIGVIRSFNSKWVNKRMGLGLSFWWYLSFRMEVINEETKKISILKNPNSFVILDGDVSIKS